MTPNLLGSSFVFPNETDGNKRDRANPTAQPPRTLEAARCERSKSWQDQVCTPGIDTPARTKQVLGLATLGHLYLLWWLFHQVKQPKQGEL